MKQHKLIIFIVCFLGVFVPELSLIAQDSFRPKDLDISTLIPEPKSIPSTTKNIVKENIDKKQKPELYTDFKRVKGGFVGVNKIDQGIASHRQINYRLSEKNTAGHWTKIEIVDADLNLKKNAGYYLLRPFENSFKDWALYPERLNDISSIDLEYDPKGEIVIRETAKDANGDVVYIGGYKYSVDPSIDQTVMSVTYTQFDDAALFKYEETKASTIRYIYKGDTLQTLELVDLDGKPLEMGLEDLLRPEYDSIAPKDKYYRIDSIMYYSNEKKYEPRDRIHKKEYRYDDKGNTIYERWTNIAGDVRYCYEKTPKYIKVQSLDGIISVDSLDYHGNITWSYQLRDGKLLTLKDGHNLRHSIYDYYDPKHPESYRVTTKYYLQRYGLHKYKRYIPAGTDSLGAPITIAVDDSIPEKYEDILYQIEEDRNLKDSTYTFKIYNDKGLYVGGHDFQSFFPEFDLRYPKQLYLEYCSLFSGYNDISPNGTPLISTNVKPNAMIVVTTGERARRLGLKDNDIIAQWDEWAYVNKNDTLPNLNRLWLYTITTQHTRKFLTVLRQEADSNRFIKLVLPEGNLEELQFTLLPAKVPFSTKWMLSTFKSDHYFDSYFKISVMMGIPNNPYTHKPIIIYAAGHHPTMEYSKKRPDPMHEWGYKKEWYGYTNNFFSLPNGEKVTAYYTDDLHGVVCDINMQQNYTFANVPLQYWGGDGDNLFKLYEDWYKSYSELEREEIELPLLEPDKEYSRYNPNEVMHNAIREGNENGYDLWYKRKPSDNAPIKDKYDYYKSHWQQWEKKYLKGAKKTYIIPLDYSNEQQTLKFVECLSEITLQGYYYSSAPWVIAETHSDNDYYVLIKPQGNDEKSISNAKNGKVGKGSKIFIYDRYNRIAAYIER